jgi:HlyD family secretion protein
MNTAMKLRVYIIFLASILLLLSSCSDSSKNIAQGYIEGRYTYIATSVSGVLEQLTVQRGTQVKQGQLLFVLESQPESDIYKASVESLNQSVAERNAIEANLDYAKLTYQRYKILVPKQAIQQSQLDNAKSLYESTFAQLSQANAKIAEQMAALAESRWTLDQKRIYAPINGVVFDTYYRIGEYTEANKAILSLLAPHDIKAIFYISEVNLGGIRLNDKIIVRCDRCEKNIQGRISFISPSAEYTPPVIYSTETNEKLVYRIEAEFTPENAVKLHPGQPISVFYSPRHYD